MARRQWQQVIDASGRRLRGLVQSGIEAGTRVDLFLQEAAAFVSARRKAQEELARQAREKRRREQQRAEAARIAAEKARQEEAREEARRLAAEKARQEQLRKQQEQARLAREKARREALARAEAEAEARAAESAVACVEDTGSQEGSADRQDSQPEFVLNGILFSYDRIDAVINNKSYQLNETVNGAKVIHIERTMVKLLYKGEVIVLRL
jgi:flagellar biosynthesis GTPase FlhF